MKEEVRAMIDATAREMKESWQEAVGRRQERQRQSLSPRINADYADLKSSNQHSVVNTQPTLEEAIKVTHQELKKQVQAELLVRIRAASAKFFETLAVELMLRLGYGGS